MLQHVGNTQKKRRRIVAENTKAQSTSTERSKFKAAGEVIVRLDEEFWAEQPFPDPFVSKMSQSVVREPLSTFPAKITVHEQELLGC